MSTFKVGRVWHTAKEYYSAEEAFQAAIKRGDPVCVWHRINKHWHLIVDRSLHSESRLPLERHLRNVLGYEDDDGKV